MSGPEETEHLDLVGLLRGELSSARTLEAEDHLRACPACRDDLLATVTGHALLTRSSRAFGEVDLPVPPPRGPLPPHQPSRVRTNIRVLVAAAAAVLVAGVGLGAAGARLLGDPDAPGRQAPEASVLSSELAPVEGAGTGRVEMSDLGDHSTRMTLRTTGLPAAPSGGFYYVWLLDPATNKMLPLGVAAPDGTTTFRIDERLLAAYSAVDVSLEADDGDPGHSITSVLRGTYDA